MFSSLKFRLWLTYILVVGVMLAIAGTAVAVYLLRNPVQDRRELQRLRLVSNIISQREVVEDFRGPEGMQILTRRASEQAVQQADGLAMLNSRLRFIRCPAGRFGKSAPPIPEWAFLPAGGYSSGRIRRERLYAVTHLDNGLILLAAVPRPPVVPEVP
jgi:hypothetical protein